MFQANPNKYTWSAFSICPAGSKIGWSTFKISKALGKKNYRGSPVMQGVRVEWRTDSRRCSNMTHTTKHQFSNFARALFRLSKAIATIQTFVKPLISLPKGSGNYTRNFYSEGEICNEEVRPESDYTSHSVARNQVPAKHKLDFLVRGDCRLQSLTLTWSHLKIISSVSSFNSRKLG